MPLGLGKGFVIFLVLAVILGYITKNFWNGVVLIIGFSILKSIWRFLIK